MTGLNLLLNDKMKKNNGVIIGLSCSLKKLST